MKMNRFFSCFTSICVGISMLSAPVCIVANAETDPYYSAEITAEPDGSIVAMITGRWTPEKYAPETLDPDYVDPTTSTGVIF